MIHGKHEHEETKATFSNTRRFAPAVIVRNLEEARQLGEIILSDDATMHARFHELFAGRHTPGFDVARDLERVAVVNQTTLLMNETLAIIEHLRDVYRKKSGDEGRVGGGGRHGDRSGSRSAAPARSRCAMAAATRSIPLPCAP